MQVAADFQRLPVRSQREAYPAVRITHHQPDPGSTKAVTPHAVTVAYLDCDFTGAYAYSLVIGRMTRVTDKRDRQRDEFDSSKGQDQPCTLGGEANTDQQ